MKKYITLREQGDAALARGEVSFIPVKFCSQGHRYRNSTSLSCYECVFDKNQRLRGKPTATDKAKEKYHNRTDEQRKRQNYLTNEWRKAHPEKVHGWVTNWQKAHPQECRIISKRYYARKNGDKTVIDEKEIKCLMCSAVSPPVDLVIIQSPVDSARGICEKCIPVCEEMVRAVKAD